MTKINVTPEGQTPPDDYIKYGSRVLVKFFEAQEPGTYSIAGVQPKVVGRFVEFTGTVRHIRGNHPTSPTEVRLWVEPDGAGEDIPICEKCGVREIGMIKTDHATLLR
jgi:hypothetical protein